MEPHEFRGVAGRYHWESTPWWPEPARPPAGAPNVLLVVLDDLGFAQLGCFGSDLETPNLDRLAAEGLRFTNFHTTALCSPTRASLLTGRNHHAVGMGRITQLATGFPGYDGRIPRSAGFLPEVLVPHGYAAWALGKWHLTPEEECNLAAPRARWPLGRGFERFYGFMGGETHHFAPEIVHDNHVGVPPATPEDGYHLTTDLVDHAIEWVDDLRAVDPEKRWMCWFATGAVHSPHHAPREWLERFRGRFDRGWDVWREETFARQQESGIVPASTELSPRPEWVPAWADLSDDERTVHARFMEAFAAFLAHTDHELGRLLDHLEARGELDDTLVVVCSDNGASSEGGPTGSINDVRTWNGVGTTIPEALEHLDEIGGPRWHNNYPWGWTVAGNTPFRRWKREVHEGGVADPLLVRWPGRIPDPGGLRRQYVHAIDVAPTILDAVGVAAPASIDGVEQLPVDGVSFLDVLADADAPEVRETQYFEMLACRALYHQGWKAVTYHPIQVEEPGIDVTPWELYHVAEDPSECHDLAAEQPERLAQMVERWWVEAGRNRVLPLDNRALSELVLERPSGHPPRDRREYRPGRSPVPEVVAVDLRNRSHTITAELDVPDGGASGVLVALGSVLGGWSFHLLDDGRPVYEHNLSNWRRYRVEGERPVPPGRHVVAFRFTRTGDHRGRGTLLVDGDPVGEGEIGFLTPNRASLTGAGLTCGYVLPIPPSDDLPAPARCTATIHRVVIEADGPPSVDARAEAEHAMRSQ